MDGMNWNSMAARFLTLALLLGAVAGGLPAAAQGNEDTGAPSAGLENMDQEDLLAMALGEDPAETGERTMHLDGEAADRLANAVFGEPRFDGDAYFPDSADPREQSPSDTEVLSVVNALLLGIPDAIATGR